MSVIHFEAPLVGIGAYTLVVLPPSASQQLPSRGQVMVKGVINNADFLAALEPDGTGGHWLNVDDHLRERISAKIGDSVSLTIEATKDWPEPEIPADLLRALRADAQVTAQWADITPMARWEWIRWVNATGNTETRQRRVEVSCSKLRGGARRPCCFNRNMCCVPQVSKNGVLLTPVTA